MPNSQNHPERKFLQMQTLEGEYIFIDPAVIVGLAAPGDSDRPTRIYLSTGEKITVDADIDNIMGEANFTFASIT